MTRFHFLIVIGLLGIPGSAHAQTAAPEAKAPACTVVGEVIVPLKPPTFGGALAWRRVQGIEGIDRLVEVLPLADGGSVTIGESAFYRRETGLQPLQLYFGRFDKSGKVVLEARTPVKDLVSVEKAVAFKDRIVVASRISGKDKRVAIGLNFFDGAGQMKSTRLISAPGMNYEPAALIVSGDGSGLTLAVTAAKAATPLETTTILLRLDAKGTVLSRRAFLPGVQTRLENLQKVAGGYLIGTGRVRGEDGRLAGWLLRLTRQGDLIAQRPYARGGQAQLVKALDDGAGGLFVLGESIPAQEGYRAAWVMHLDPQGEVIWQRFFTGKYSYRAVDGLALKDGRVQVLLAGHPTQEGGREHARVLTLSARGDLLADEGHLEGSNAVPVRLIQHSVTGHRILGGYVQTGFADYGVPENMKLATYDIWLAQFPALDLYEDPCRPPPKETLDDFR